MFVLIGLAVVIFSVIVGFMIAGGNLMVLLQWSEFLVIGGAAIGSLLISSPLSLLKKIIKQLTGTIKPSHYNKENYLELLKVFNEIFALAQREGLLSLEAHIEKPEESAILSKNKKFIDDEEIKTFFCDTMKVFLTGGIPPHELENLIDTEIETYELESKPIYNSVARVGDSLPGLGIVAAVLGIIVTMGSIDKGASYVGLHVAAALVGTFLGVLLSYGFVNPLAANIEHNLENRVRVFYTTKASIVAYAKGNPPIIAVEMARRTIFSDDRPTFSELEKFIRGKT